MDAATQSFGSALEVKSHVLLKFLKTNGITVNGTTSWYFDYDVDDLYVITGLEATKIMEAMPNNQTDLLTVTASVITGDDATGTAIEIAKLSLTSTVSELTRIGTKKIAGSPSSADSLVSGAANTVLGSMRVRITITATRATLTFNPSCFVDLTLARFDNSIEATVA